MLQSDKTLDASRSVARVFIPGLLYVLWGVFILSFVSQMNIPLKPVPITMQTFGVMLIGLTFERRAAIQSILAYLALGALGLPIFAEFRSGYSCLLGPTGGYLIGFLVAVIIMSNIRLVLKQNSFFALSFNCLIGTFVIMAFGVAWLSTFMGFKPAIQAGFVPFVIPGLIKAGLLALIVRFIYFRKK